MPPTTPRGRSSTVAWTSTRPRSPGSSMPTMSLPFWRSRAKRVSSSPSVAAGTASPATARRRAASSSTSMTSGTWTSTSTVGPPGPRLASRRLRSRRHSRLTASPSASATRVRSGSPGSRWAAASAISSGSTASRSTTSSRRGVGTAECELHRVDAEHEPDLFWAIRGGGGNFGVATRFQFRVHPVGTIVGGMMMLPASPDVIHSFMALAEAAPEELSTIANVMPAPPMPFVPAEHHGKLVIFAMLCYAGAVEAGERAVAPFRALAAPIVDMVKPSRYPEMYPPDDPDYHPIATGRTLFMDSVDRDVADTIVEHLGATDAHMRVAQLRVLGGAMARVPVEATAFAHRESRIMVNVAALYERPDQAPVYEPWVTGFAAALKQGDSGAYEIGRAHV